MAILTQVNGEIELFEQSLRDPDAVRYLWRNAHSMVGVVFGVNELERVLGRIGTNPAWDFVHVRSELDGKRWTQACGRASNGLVVEVNGPHLVAVVDAPLEPRVDVGTSTWSYLASPAELHTVEAVASRQMVWLNNEELVAGDELRAVYQGARRQS